MHLGSLSGQAIGEVVVRFSRMSFDPDKRHVSGVIFNQCEETSQRSLLFTGPFWRPPLIVPAPPDVPALAEALLDVGAISPYFDHTLESLERLAHCGQFHSIVRRLHGASDKLLRTAVPFDHDR